LRKAERDLLDKSHRHVLRKNGVDFVEISGDWEERFERAKGRVDLILGRE